MVEIMTGKEIQPTCKICVMLSPKPNKITAHCKIFLDVNPIPAPVFSRFQEVKIDPIIIPKMMAKIGLRHMRYHVAFVFYSINSTTRVVF